MAIKLYFLDSGIVVAARKMEQAFVESLLAKGISGSTLEVLEKEEIVSVEC